MGEYKSNREFIAEQLGESPDDVFTILPAKIRTLSEDKGYQHFHGFVDVDAGVVACGNEVETEEDLPSVFENEIIFESKDGAKIIPFSVSNDELILVTPENLEKLQGAFSDMLKRQAEEFFFEEGFSGPDM